MPVLNVTLREFFNSVQAGKDSESSWKKQIYKIIARFDEQIPEYFKTPEFLKQLEWANKQPTKTWIFPQIEYLYVDTYLQYY